MAREKSGINPAVRHSIHWDGYMLLLGAALVIYVVVFAQLAFDFHLGMRTHKADLGQIDQAVWNSSRGRWLAMTDNGFESTRLIDHVEPILVLISPIFWLWDDVRALLLLQVMAVALGALPLYALTLARLDQLLTPAERAQIWQVEPLRQLTRPLALIVAVAYLLAPQLQSAVLTEFHAVPLAAPLILWALWAIERQRWGQFALASLLVASVKEETALLAAGLGVWALWRVWSAEYGMRSAKFRIPYSAFLASLLVILLSLIWFYLATFVIVPAHAVTVYGKAESGYFARYGVLGNSPVDIFKSFLTQPGVVWRIASEPARLAYLRNLLLGFGFFSLLAPELLLITLPVLLANLLSAYPAQYYGEFHYSAPLVPYFAASAAYGLGRLWRWLGSKINHSSAGFQHLAAASTGVMALAAFARNSRTTLRPVLALLLGIGVLSGALTGYLAAGRGPGGGRYDPTPITAHHRLLARFLAQIPAEAALTATAAVHPHVSHRRYVYQFPIGLEPPGAADWALLDVTTNTDMAPGDLKTRVAQMLAADWGVVDAADGFLLLHKGAATKTIPPAFLSFTRLADAPPATDANAENHLPRLQQVSVQDWPRWRETKIVTEWAAPQTFDPAGLSLGFGVYTPDGTQLYRSSDAFPPAWLWYPPPSWQPVETTRATTLQLYLPRIWGVVARQLLTTGTVDNQVRAADGMASLTAIYARQPDGQLTALPIDLFHKADWGQTLATHFKQPLAAASATLRPTPNQTLTLRAGWPDQPLPPGGTLNLWLQWQGKRWPADLTVFVHLRHNGQNRTQADGPPRYFVLYNVDETLHGQGFANDWRQLTLPPDLHPGDQLTLVVGLYQPQNGQRAEVVDASGQAIGNEFTLGQITVGAPATPDQSCALIPATCASQP